MRRGSTGSADSDVQMSYEVLLRSNTTQIKMRTQLVLHVQEELHV